MCTGLDEADFAKTFFTVVLPLMSDKHVLLATSSPRVGGGSYTNAIFARDGDGNKLMNSVILGDPCPMCRAGPNPESCPHKQDELASWKDPKRMARLEKIYRAVGGEDIGRSELHAMARENVSTLFPKELYNDLLCPKPKSLEPGPGERDKVSVVYVAVDPAGGGKCEFAVTAIGHVKQRREFQVLLFCAETLSTPRCEQRQIRAIIEGTVQKLREHPRVGHGVPIIFEIEGCGPDAAFISAMLVGDDPFPDVLVMTEMGAHNRFGVPKNERITRAMVATTEVMLSLGIISIPSDAIALSTPFATKVKTMRDYRETLALQFSSFRLCPGTGKMSGKEHGGNDDLLVTFMMAPFWMTEFAKRTRPEYLEFKAHYDPQIWLSAQPGALIAAREGAWGDNYQCEELKRANKQRKVD